MAQTIDTDIQTNHGFIASATVTKNHLVMLDTSNNFPYVLRTTNDTDSPIGIALADAVSGEVIPLAPLDGKVHSLVASGAISEGAYVCPDGGSDGKIKTAASGDQICGTAQMASLADGDIIPVLCFHGWLKA